MKKSNYLSHETISKLENLYIKAKKVVEGFIVGLNKSPYHGFSVEFSDHRAYGPGDEIRHIDWKLWGKTDRFYVKRYEEETNLKAHILIDQSNSMGYASNDINKLEYSKILAASLSYMLIKNQDAVGLYMFDSGIKKIIPPHSNKGHLSVVLSEMDKIKPNKDTNIAKALHECAEKTNKKGLIILISDLMDDENDIIKGLKHFIYKGHEVIIVTTDGDGYFYDKIRSKMYAPIRKKLLGANGNIIKIDEMSVYPIHCVSNRFGMYCPSATKEAKKIIKKFDLVYVINWYYHLGMVFTKISHELGTPFIVGPMASLEKNAQNIKKNKKFLLDKLYTNKMIKNATGFHCVGEHERKYLMKLGVNSEKIHLINNGISRLTNNIKDETIFKKINYNRRFNLIQ